jgi:HK97 gp10 family phage protein
MARGNVQALNRRLMAIPQEVRAAARQQLIANAAELVRMQQSLAPVDSGDLRKSIRAKAGRNELQIMVVAGGALTTREVRKGSGRPYDYALGQEYGNAQTPAQPFFFPSYRALKKPMKSKLSRAANKAIKKAAGA